MKFSEMKISTQNSREKNHPSHKEKETAHPERAPARIL